MHQSWTRKPQKPLVRKNRDRLPRPNAVALPLGFEGQSMNKQNEKEIMKREITQKNKPKCERTSGKADRRMSQVSQPSLLQTYHP